MVELSTEVTSVLDLVPDAVLIHRNGSWIYANPPAARLFGVPAASDLIGRRLDEVIPFADRAGVAQRVQQVMAGSPEPRRDEKLIRYDGQEIDISVSANPIALDSGVAVILVMRDITERITLLQQIRATEARFKKLVENSFDAIEVLDAQGALKYIGGRGETLLGYPAEVLLGQNVFALFHPDDLPRAVEKFRYVTSTPRQTVVATFRMRAASGAWRMIEGVAVNMLHDPDIAGIVLNARDVTEREELARDLERMRRIESLGTVASKVAHEFNNLLMSISPWAEVLKRGYANDKRLQEAAVAITDAVQKCRRLTEEIRQFGRELDIRRRDTSVPAWLDRLAPTLRGALPESVRLEIHSAPDARAPLDADQIGQVILNLVSNARDAMTGGGHLEVAARMASANELEIAVSDNGPGIPVEIQERIFEPFFTTKRTGTGLGLAVCQQIVSRHGGRLRVESVAGKGAKFTILLPAT